MTGLFTTQNITLAILIFGGIFQVFFYFRNPQVNIEKEQAISNKEVDGKAMLLAQQVQWEKDANAQKFKDVGDSMSAAMTLAQNHVHSIDVKLESFIQSQGQENKQVGESLVKIFTILEERLPK